MFHSLRADIAFVDNFLQSVKQDRKRFDMKKLHHIFIKQPTLLQKYNSRTLISAILQNDPPLSLLKTILEHQPDCFSAWKDPLFRRTPLHVACSSGASLDVVQWLHQQQPEWIDHVNWMGGTCLHSACQQMQLTDVIRYLVEQNPNALATGTSEGILPVEYVAALSDPKNPTQEGKDLIEYLGKHYPHDTLKLSMLRDAHCHDKCHTFLYMIECHTNLQRLDATQWNLNNESFKALCQLCKDKEIPEVLINLDDPKSTPCVQTVQDLLENNTSLTHLSLQLGSTCRHIVTKSCRPTVLTGLSEVLIKGLNLTNKTPLKSISINEMNLYCLTPEAFTAILDLESVQIAYSPWCADKIEECLTPQSGVRQLAVGRSWITSNDLERMASKIKSSNIRKLSIEERTLQTREDSEALGRAVRDLHQVENVTLQLANLPSTAVVDHVLVNLLETSACLKNLQVLCRGWSSDDMAKIANALKVSKLEHMSFGVIQDKAELELGPLLDVLKRHNTSLKTLALFSWKNTCNDLEEEIQYYCRLNAAGRSEIRQMNITKERYVEQLLKQHSQDPCISYGMLREIPHLWSN